MISKISDGFLFTKRIRKYLKLLCKTQSNHSIKLEFIYILQKFAWFIWTCYLCMTFMLQLWCKNLAAGFCGVLWFPTIYNIIRWFTGTNDSSTKRLMLQLFFFIISCNILCKNSFNSFIYLFFYFTKIKVKSFECRWIPRNTGRQN